MFQLVLIVSGPGTGYHRTKSFSVLFAPFHQVFIWTGMIPLSFLFPRWDSWGPSGCQCNPLAYQPLFLVLCHQQTSWGCIPPHHPEHYWRCYRTVLILGVHCWLLASIWASFCWSPPLARLFRQLSVHLTVCLSILCINSLCGRILWWDYVQGFTEVPVDSLDCSAYVYQAFILVKSCWLLLMVFLPSLYLEMVSRISCSIIFPEIKMRLTICNSLGSPWR